MKNQHHPSNHQQSHQIRFTVRKRARFGRAVYVCGNIAELGQWNPEKGVRLCWNQGDVWTGSVKLSHSISKKVQFKYIVNYKDCPSVWDVQWQAGIHNRKICMESSCKNQICDDKKCDSKSPESCICIDDKWNMDKICLYLLASQSTEKLKECSVIGDTDQLGNWKNPKMMKKCQKQKLPLMFKQVLPKQENSPESLQIFCYSFETYRGREQLHYCYVHEGDTYQHEKQLQRVLKFNEEKAYQHFRRSISYSQGKIGVVDECDVNEMIFSKKPDEGLIKLKHPKKEQEKVKQKLTKQQKKVQNRFLRLIKSDEYKPDSIAKISKQLNSLACAEIKDVQDMSMKIQEVAKEMIMQRISNPLSMEAEKKKIQIKIRSIPQIQKEVKLIQSEIQTMSNKCPDLAKQIKKAVQKIENQKKAIVQRNRVEIKQGAQKNEMLIYCENLDVERIQRNLECQFGHQNSFNVCFERVVQGLRGGAQGMIEGRLCIKINFEDLFAQLLVQSKNIQQILCANSPVKNEFSDILASFIKDIEERSNEMKKLSQQLKDQVNPQQGKSEYQKTGKTECLGKTGKTECQKTGKTECQKTGKTECSGKTGKTECQKTGKTECSGKTEKTECLGKKNEKTKNSSECTSSAPNLEQKMRTIKNKSKLLEESLKMAQSLVERIKQQASSIIEVSQKIKEIEEIEENRNQLKQYFVDLKKKESQRSKVTPSTSVPVATSVPAATSVPVATKSSKDTGLKVKAKVEVSQKIREKIKLIGKKPNALKETKDLLSPDLSWWRSGGLSDKMIIDDLMRICEVDEQTAKGLINA